MSLVATPTGAEPVGTLSSSGSFSGKMRHIPIASAYDTAIFYGDFVKLVAGGVVEKDAGTATMTPVGVFLGCSFTDPTTKQLTFSQYWPANTVAADAVAHVADDPNLLMSMQANGAVEAVDLGQNAAVIQTAGSTSIGRSKNAVNSVTATTAAMPLRIIDFVDGPNSTAGDAYTDLIVTYNAGHQYGNTTGI